MVPGEVLAQCVQDQWITHLGNDPKNAVLAPHLALFLVAEKILGKSLGDHVATLEEDLPRGVIDDVFGDGSLKQTDILGQIAEPGAELVRFVLIEGRAVETDIPCGDRPDADQGASEAGFAGSALADDAKRFARLEGQGHVSDRRHALAGRQDGHLLERERCFRARQMQAP